MAKLQHFSDKGRKVKMNFGDSWDPIEGYCWEKEVGEYLTRTYEHNDGQIYMRQWSRNDGGNSTSFVLDREDGPALECRDGSGNVIKDHWYRNGQLHRDGGPAVEELFCGFRAWYRNGELHRDDGPAVETADGTKEWYRNGKRHREDGPAKINADGTQAWFVNGRELNDDEITAIKVRQRTRASEDAATTLKTGLPKPITVSKPFQIKKPPL